MKTPEQMAQATTYSLDQWLAAADRLGDHHDQLWPALVRLVGPTLSPVPCAEALVKALALPIVNPLQAFGP